ncbi:retrovirus-related pol polyprotein from transposon TNT 1-94 [Tanacetum coccineum]
MSTSDTHQQSLANASSETRPSMLERVNASRAKKLEKSHDPLALVAHTGSSSRTTTPYYVTNPSSVVDYNDDYQGDVVQNNSEDPLTSAMILLARTIVNVQCYNCSEKGHYACNCPKLRVRDLKYFMEQMLLAKQDEAGVILTDKQNDFLFADASRMEEIEELNNQEQKYSKQPKIINNTIGDDQIDSNIIFNEPNGDVNSGSVVYDNNVQQQNTVLTKQLESYKEKESQSQFIHDRDAIQNLEEQRDKLELSVVELKRQTVELQKTQSILKCKISENEDQYHDTVLDLEVRAKKNEDVVLKIGLRSISSVRRPSHRDSSFKNSVLSNTKNSSEKVEVSDRTNKKSNVASKNVDSNKKIVTNDDIKNALIAKNVLCVSCAKNVLIPCHDNCLAKYKLNVLSKVRRALFTTSRTVKSKFEDPTPIVLKTLFSVKTVQSKSLDTTFVVSKTKIDAVTPLSAKHKVSSAFKLRDNSLSNYMKNKIRTS